MATPTHTKPPTIGNDADWEILVNEERVLVRQRRKKEGTDPSSQGTAVLSHAVLNGGLQFFSADQRLQVLNAKVPLTYDGGQDHIYNKAIARCHIQGLNWIR